MRKPLPRKRKLMGVMLPYCIERIAGSSGYVLLNRNYKPIGFNTANKVDYKKYPIVHHLRITPKTAAMLSWNNDTGTEKIFLYGDSLMEADLPQYFKRLAHLSKMLAKTDTAVQVNENAI